MLARLNDVLCVPRCEHAVQTLNAAKTARVYRFSLSVPTPAEIDSNANCQMQLPLIHFPLFVAHLYVIMGQTRSTCVVLSPPPRLVFLGRLSIILDFARRA